MGKIYENARVEDYEIMRMMIARFHDRLIDTDTRVQLTIVRKFNSQDEEVPCLRFAGAQAAAVARPIAPRQKLHLQFDAEITLDGHVWDSLNIESKRALIDHELTHLEPMLDRRTSEPKKCDRGFQIIRCRRDDFLLTGFLEVVRRHGRAALEFNSVVGANAGVHQALEEFEASQQPATATPAAPAVEPSQAEAEAAASDLDHEAVPA